ncbi:MAG: DUF2892 domain-containing protein [Prolixibacteraceae bacterium]|nr:DUF2892 domain-containing protein [Prolixibacteraceae bacterium]
MKKNMGTVDIIIRLVVAIVLVILYFNQVITGAWGIVMLVVAGIFLVTSMLGFCPLYVPFKISTRKKKN